MPWANVFLASSKMKAFLRDVNLEFKRAHSIEGVTHRPLSSYTGLRNDVIRASKSLRVSRFTHRDMVMTCFVMLHVTKRCGPDRIEEVGRAGKAPSLSSASDNLLPDARGLNLSQTSMLGHQPGRHCYVIWRRYLGVNYAGWNKLNASDFRSDLTIHQSENETENL